MVANAKDLNVSVGTVVIVNLIYVVEHIANNCSESNTTGPCPPPVRHWAEHDATVGCTAP
jgi:hypothetical protein